jgi:hypothetical protein
VIKVNGGEKESERENMPRRRKSSRISVSDIKDLLMAIAGFLFVAFGLLLLLLPANYPISILPVTYNPLLGIALMALGVFLLVRSMD